MFQVYHEGKWKHWLYSVFFLLAWYSHYGAFVPLPRLSCFVHHAYLKEGPIGL